MWKDPEGRVISASTRDVAVAQLQAFRKEVVSGRTGTAKCDVVSARVSYSSPGGGWMRSGRRQPWTL
ncbi:hypothetical protein RHMOL_Rhmol05G0294900 [Rhododendron molle]|uniref:Uncharacterized protein n=1 Tax=Rhododendron molle TaxID=49168 RepID=A0ACC0NVW5_RHOML|nr:hypothetical protein RHMOL_Rhmol05G0294900 [Rhododendron molle]